VRLAGLTPAELALLGATFAFVGSHFLLSHPLRRPLVARLGERAFLGLYSLVALAGLAAMILAWRCTVDVFPWWNAPTWWWWGGSFVMLFATILLLGSLFGNPALPHPGAEPRTIPEPRGVFAITRHPMNWAFILWALVHISLWGTPRNIIVAGGILILALFGSIGQDRRKARALGPEFQRWQASTAFIPFADQLSGRISWRAARPGWVAGLGGFILWMLITWWHAPNVSPIAYYFDFRHAF
jgi:uncharacterized membrane protein